MKLKFKYAEMHAFLFCINAAVSAMDKVTDEDCLLLATLEELQLKLQQKFLERKSKYSFTLKPTYAFAIRTVFAGHTRLSFEGNLIGQVCDEAHKIYSNNIN